MDRKGAWQIVRASVTVLCLLASALGVMGFFHLWPLLFGHLPWRPLPSSFEWPVGHETCIVTLPGDIRVVPLKSAGRVQVYDSNWRFLRGWSAMSRGGTFVIRPADPETVDVFVARSELRHRFSLDGTLLSSSPMPGVSSDFFMKEGPSTYVPTSPWLYVFSSPLLGWACMVFGFLGSAVPWLPYGRIRRELGIG